MTPLGHRASTTGLRTSSLGFLTFSRNDVEAVIRSIHSLRASVDEIVVVDSSYPAERAQLVAEVRAPRERVVLAPPLGNVDLLRPFGLSNMTTDRVLQLDSDESLSPPLFEALRGLDSDDAYVIPRWEGGVRGFTHHMRLYRRRSVRYRGRSHAFPEVRGTTRTLPRGKCIIHDLPPAQQYWDSGDRRRRYLLSDSLASVR